MADEPECPYTPEPSKLFCNDYPDGCEECIAQLQVTGLAEEHAEWFADTIKKITKVVYNTAFIHGYKHGKEEAKE